jgi:hypothetical protein
MARVMNPAIRVALILQAVAAGLAGAQAIVWRFDRPAEEMASAIPRARGGNAGHMFHHIPAKSLEVLAASSSRAEGLGQ